MSLDDQWETMALYCGRCSYGHGFHLLVYLEIPGADHRSLFCGSLFVAVRQVSSVVVPGAVEEQKMEQKKETQADPQADTGAQV